MKPIEVVKMALRPDQKDDVKEDLALYFGVKPYDSPGNYCYADGYFARAVEKKYGGTIDDLVTETGFKLPRRG